LHTRRARQYSQLRLCYAFVQYGTEILLRHVGNYSYPHLAAAFNPVPQWAFDGGSLFSNRLSANECSSTSTVLSVDLEIVAIAKRIR